MLNLELSESASNDIESILDYTYNKFESSKMFEYSFEIDNNLLLLRQNSAIGHKRNDIPND